MAVPAKKTLLLVEDEAILALTEKKQLENYGYSVRTVSSGQKAVDCVKEFPEIDLILMDINLGEGIDGTQAAEIILTERDIPIVFVSSHTEPEIVEKTEKITSYGYVVKNSSITVLDASIKMAFKLFDAKKSEMENEKALQKSELKYRLISDNTSDGVIHFSSTWTIDYISPAYIRQIGYSEADEIGKSFEAIVLEVHPDDRDVLFSSLFEAIKQKKSELTYVYRFRHAKGHFIWREDHANFLYDDAGTYLGAYVTCRDITERKKIESKLEILGKALESSPAIIMVTDHEGAIEYVNPKFSAITGYSREEAIGKNPRFLKSGKTDEQVYVDLWNTLIAGNEWKGYFRNKKKSGELYYESATIAPVKNERGEIVNYIAVKEDLTERRYMQDSLEESNIRFNTLAGSKSVLIWESGPDMLCTYFNPTWLEYTGRAMEDEIGDGWVEGVHPDDLDRCLAIYAEAFESRMEFTMEYRLRKASGAYGWILDHGTPKYHGDDFIGFIGSCIDITERKAFEKILQQSEEKFRLLHESAGIGIGYYSLDGIVLSYNKLAAQHMGGAPEDFIGTSIFSLFPKKDAEKYSGRLQAAALSEKPAAYEDKVPLPSGDLYFLSTFTRVAESNGTIAGIQIISQDITRLKTAEIGLQLKNEEYEAANEELRSTTEELKTQNEELAEAHEMLRQSESRLVQAEKIARIGNWELQLKTRTMHASHGAESIYGVDSKKAPYAELKMIPLPEYRPMLDEALSGLIAGDAPYDLEFKIKRPGDGSIVDVHSVATFDKKKNTVFGVLQDVTELKKSELAMRASLQKFNLLLNSVTEGIYGVDGHENCTFCNESCLKLLGYADEDELLGKNMHWLIHGKRADGSAYPIEDCPIAQNFSKGIGTHIDDEVFWRADGTYFHAEYWSNPQLQDGKVIGAVMSFVDIGTRKQTEEALQESEDRFKKLSAFTFEGIVIHNKGIAVDCNDSMISLLGYDREEIIGMNLFKMIHPDFHALVRDNMVKQIATPYQIVLKRKDGSFFDAEIEGKNISYNGESFRVACIRDITERKRMEVELEESRERLRFALDVSGLGQWELDLRTNTVSRNERWAGMLGYTLSEIEESFQQGVDLQHPDDREMVAKAVRDYHEGRIDEFKIDYRMRAKDGSYKWIQDCGKTFERDETGRPVRFCGTHADITQQKEKEEKITKLLAEKELLLKEVHHRIKNNMNTVNSLLSLQAGSISEPDAIKALQDAGSRIHSMSVLYDKLYRSSDFNEASVKEYVSSLVDDILGNFPNSRKVTIEKRLHDFKLDAKRLQPLGIIINELITNIMKYAFNDRETGVIAVSATDENGHVSISIQDDGIGMPDSISFENSTGFGLQLVHALTLQLQGTIRIERGFGTNVVLEFDL